MSLTDEIAERVWIWSSSGLRASFTDWNQGEPNNDGGSQDCAHFHKEANGKWDDITCHHDYAPLCEKRYYNNLVCNLVLTMIRYDLRVLMKRVCISPYFCLFKPSKEKNYRLIFRIFIRIVIRLSIFNFFSVAIIQKL